MSKAHMPPVPPANRPPHGGAQAEEAQTDEKSPASARDFDPAQVGQTANTQQNTNNQGRQQDR